MLRKLRPHVIRMQTKWENRIKRWEKNLQSKSFLVVC
jgi:hypothetical protein